MSKKQDCYKILGVPKDADLATIKKAYREKAMIYHEDKNPSQEARKKWDDINEAYAHLSDPEKRHVYDKGRKSAVTDDPHMFLTQEWEEIFEQGLKR